jgi:site-specific recombinase XerD
MEMVERVGLVEAAALAVPDLLGEFEHDGRTGGRFTREIDLFVARAVLEGVDSVSGVTAELVAAFCGEAVQGRDGSWRTPAASTRRTRRAAIRWLFRWLRHEGICVADPTIDVKVSEDAVAGPRPLTDVEVAECRLMSDRTLSQTRLPACWALAEATLTTGEMSRLVVGDVDLVSGTLDTPGLSRGPVARTVPLTDWGAAALARRVEELVGGGGDASTPVVYRSGRSLNGGGATAGQAINRILTYAGLSNDPSATAKSVIAWRARKAFEQSGRIEAAARLIGSSSLDATARLIGLDWTVRP